MGDVQNTGEAPKDSVTLSKDMLYGGVIVVLSALLLVSVFTAGFGVIKAQQTICPVCGNSTGNPSGVTPQLPALPALTVGVGGLPAEGSASAAVTIVQFSDYQCPYCGRLYTGAEAQVKTTYIQTGKVKMYFRDFPLSFHPNAMPAAIAANCADAQGKFWQMHDKLFETQSAWSSLSDTATVFKGYASDLGLNADTFASCIDGKTPAAKITAGLSEAQTYGVGGTPASFIIVPKAKIDSQTIRDAVDGLNTQYGAGAISLYEDATSYTVLIGGAYPYTAFDAVLSKVSY